MSELLIHPTSGRPPRIRPARPLRAWMEATPDRFAGRCLPLTMANAYGWEALVPATVEAMWDGGTGADSVTVRYPPDPDPPAAIDRIAASHFGSGILTFSLHALLRTAPGVNLWVGGPVNEAKDGLHPLSGLVETDWSPYGFTMNWRFTRPGHWVRFEADEPFCQFFPVEPAMLEATRPAVRDLDADPALHAHHAAWVEFRARFIAELAVPGSPARERLWQRDYMRGTCPDGVPAAQARPGAQHRTRIRVAPVAGLDDPVTGDTGPDA